MEARLSVLILVLLCVAGIRSEVSDEHKSSDASEVVADGDSSHLHSFAAEILKLLAEGTKMDGLSNNTDINQKLDYAKSFLLSEKENVRKNPDLQKKLEAKIEMLETLSKFLNSSHGNAKKEKLENMNGYENFAWSSPTKMKNLAANGNNTLKQSQNGQNIVKITLAPSSELFGETTNGNKTLKDDILKQSQNGQNLVKITFSPSTELLGDTINGNMTLKDDILNQSQNGQNHVKTTFPPSNELFGENETTVQTVLNTDSEYMKNQLTPTDKDNLDELYFKDFLGGLFSKSEVNSSHLNITNASQILPSPPIGKPSSRDEKQIFLDLNRNPISTGPFGDAINGNMTLKDDILNQSQNGQNRVKTTFPPSSELFGKNETTFQTVFNTDSEYMKDQLIPTNNNNLAELFFSDFFGGLFPKSKVNSSHLNTSQILPSPPSGTTSRPDEKQIFLDSNRNPDKKDNKFEMIFDMWKKILNEMDDGKKLDKHIFLNLSSSTSVTGMEMNMTDPTSHQPKFDELTSSTLEISNMSHSIKELSTMVNDVNSTMFNASHKVNEPGKMIFPSGNVSSKITTFDFIKDNVKRSGKAKDIQNHFLNVLENKTDPFTVKSFANYSDSTFNDTKITFKKQYPWNENIPPRFNGDSKEANSFTGFETKKFQLQFNLENNTERDAPKWNLPTTKTQHSNMTEEDFKNFQTTTLMSPNALPSEVNNSLIKQFPAIVVPTNFEMNYTISADHILKVDPSKNRYNNNETNKHSSSLSINGNELLTSAEGLNEIDRQQSFLGAKAKLLKNRINAIEKNSGFLVNNISMKKEHSTARGITQEYADNLEQNRSALTEIYTHETEFGQLKEESKISNIKASESGNIMEITKQMQRDQKIWTNPLYFNLFKTLAEMIVNKLEAKYGNSTINRRLEEKLDKMVKIQTPLAMKLEHALVLEHALGHQIKPINNTLVYVDRNVKPKNMEQKFWNENNQSLLNETKSFSSKHSDQMPGVYSSIKIEYNEYINDRYDEEAEKGDLMNSQVEYRPNNGTNQLVKKKRSEEKD